MFSLLLKDLISDFILVFLLRRVAARKVSFSHDCCICYGIVQCVTDNGYVTDKEVEDSVRPVCQTYDFSTLYTTLPHNLIKEKLINLTERTFKRENSPYSACNERQAFFISGDTKRYKLWSCQNVCEALIYLLDNIYFRFGTKLFTQIVGILHALHSFMPKL